MDVLSGSIITFILVVIVVYILFTTWLTMRFRSKSSSEFNNAAKTLPAIVVGILLMSEFIGTKSTIGTAESAYTHGLAASWSIVTVSIAFFIFSYFLAGKFYKTGQYTISGIISEKFGRSTKLVVSIIMIVALSWKLFKRIGGNFVYFRFAADDVCDHYSDCQHLLFYVWRNEGRCLGDDFAFSC
ncbi:hypothetical protein CHCC20348_1350 [Bacillus paralicheniformis]|nr:hypothetical protein CHCC20348_1350 [Bacillus paralicheniformis]